MRLNGTECQKESITLQTQYERDAVQTEKALTVTYSVSLTQEVVPAVSSHRLNNSCHQMMTKRHSNERTRDGLLARKLGLD